MAGAPGADLGGPVFERRVIVAADIELLVAVQADVDEVGSDVFHLRPFAGGVGDDEGDVVLAKEFHKGGVFVGIVADFHRVAERAELVGFCKHAAFESAIVLLCELGGFFGIAREEREKVLQPIRIESQHGRQLPEEGA